MDTHGKCADCGGPVKTAGRERCVPCANRKRAAAQRAARPICIVCQVNQVSRKSATVCTACWLATRGRGATPEAEAERVRKIKAAGFGKHERTPEVREKMAAAKRGKESPKTQGEHHWAWKGGRKGGAGPEEYIRIRVGSGRYKSEHRALMVQHLGRDLEPGEEVHHINRRRNDNRLENLIVVTRSEHRRMEGSLMRAAADAMEFGLIVFENGAYRFIPPITAS